MLKIRWVPKNIFAERDIQQFLRGRVSQHFLQCGIDSQEAAAHTGAKDPVRRALDQERKLASDFRTASSACFATVMSRPIPIIPIVSPCRLRKGTFDVAVHLAFPLASIDISS